MRRLNPEAAPKRRSATPRRRARSRRPTPVLRLGGGALLLMAMGGLAWWASASGWAETRLAAIEATALRITAEAGLSVETVLVEGRKETGRSEILKVLGVDRGQPILAFDPAAAKARIEALPWVAGATVERRFPGTVFVRIEERAPFALWQHGQKLALIDRAGEVIVRGDLARWSRLPMVVGEDAARHAAEIVDLLASQPDLYVRVDAAVRVAGRRWNVKLDSGVDVRLPEEDAAAAWTRLAALARDERLLERDLVLIDLRQPDRLIVRLSPDATETEAEPGKST